MLNLAEYRKRPASLADYLPWACLIAPGIILNKDGSLQRTIGYRGPDLESSTANELIAITARINNMLRRFGSGWALYFEATRRSSTSYPTSNWRDPAAWLLDEERRGAFEEAGRHFETDHYLTLAWLPPSDRTGRVEKLLIDDPADAPSAFWDTHMELFETATRRALDLFSDLMPNASFLDDDTTLTYLHDCISVKRHAVQAPAIPMYLDRVIADTSLTGGLAPSLGDEALRVLTIQGFPATTEPELLSALDALGFEYRWMTRFLPLDKREADKTLQRFRRNWFAKRKSITAILKETLSNEPSPLINTDAENKAADADAALQSLGADHVGFGYMTTAITLRHPDPAIADDRIRAAERIINGQGFTCISETVNAVDAWLGTLPGNAYANVRQPLVHTLNLAHITPLSTVWAGPEYNAHLNGPPLLMATTSSGTPFRLVTHQGDVGHTLIVGPTGAGKSVLLSLLAMQFCRYNDAQVFVFDKGLSARCAMTALGGDHFDLGLNGDLAFQPLALIDDPAEIAAAQTWVLGLLAQEGVETTPDTKDAVWTALQSLAETPVSQRTLTGLTALLQSSVVRQALQPYTLRGPYGALLDAASDSLTGADRLCFEMEDLMHDSKLAAPVLSYLFHRLEARFDGRPTLLILDEAWVFLDHPMFAGRLREWLKTLRKKNVSVVFATQSLADIAGSSIAATIIESCPTRLFLPNLRAEEQGQAETYERFGLNARQIEIIARSTPKRDYYIQSGAGNRLFDLELGPVALAFCASGSKADQALMTETLAYHGHESFAAEWLTAKGLSWAANIIAEEGAIQCAAE